MENPVKMDDLGGNTPIFGNTQIKVFVCLDSVISPPPLANPRLLQRPYDIFFDSSRFDLLSLCQDFFFHPKNPWGVMGCQNHLF